MQHLQINSTLQGGKYRIISVLGQGGFGITYLAEQVMLARKVCIKEFFFKDCCDRDESTSHVTLGTQANKETVKRFLNKFLKEARTISQLDHPNIIKIHDIFEENNTAYYVMDYVEGENLSELVKRQGALSEVTAVQYICKVANALKYIHAKSINHLDVKPGNIMLRKNDGEIVLIDFGLAKQYDDAGSQTSSTPVGISQGYAPIEQYRAGGVSQFSPQTDIYSLGATLYWLIIGKIPPAADEILDEGLPALPSYTSAPVQNAIKAAMQARKKDRPESVDKWLGILLSGNAASAEKSSKSTLSSNVSKTTSEETVVIGEKSQKPFDFISFAHEKRFANNVALTKTKASQGEVDYMLALACYYIEGTMFGCPKNLSEAYSILMKLKNQGEKRAEEGLKKWQECRDKDIKESQSKSSNPSPSNTSNTSSSSDSGTKTAIGILAGFIIAIIVIVLCAKNCNGNSNSTGNLSESSVGPNTIHVNNEHIYDVEGDYYWTGDEINDSIADGYDGYVPHGQGKAVFLSNDKYNRKEYNGKMEYGYRRGEGTLTYKNGDYFEGTFNNNYFEKGTFYSFASGEYYKGTFSNNQPYNGSWYNKSGKVIQNVVNGR